jgi:hypothetical protein
VRLGQPLARDVTEPAGGALAVRRDQVACPPDYYRYN